MSDTMKTPTSGGFQERFNTKFKGKSQPATTEEVANLYAALMGVIDVLLVTHRVIVHLPLTIEQRKNFEVATNDMDTLISVVANGIERLEAQAEADDAE